MPPRKFRKRNTDDDDDDERGGKSSSRAAKRQVTSEDDGVVACELSSNRLVKVRKFNGHVLVDIREFYSKGDDLLPSKKGISLTLDQWHVFVEHFEEVEAALKEMEGKA
eukprot:TRINITY_DN10334_c0_g1_i1.p1 TRINITY_DN10334_c0_g1~~TRINITY_DN10334_c0_g1_i1.p1  ORF type:complete len:109 (+),score=26.75 TRINITY_DN10334_c0_g1_i1:166-492(+)